MHPAQLPIETLARDCEVSRTRRGGPGGQHRNKVETAVVITHRPTGLRGEAGERRSQAQNLAMAWQRLRVSLAVEVRSTEIAESGASALWLSRVRAGKIAVSNEHADYPALLAEVLDALQAADWNVPQTVERLAVSASQLVKFLQSEPRAIALLNNVRRERGQKAYQ
jgi:hypothetical protein